MAARSEMADLEHGEQMVEVQSEKMEWLKMALPGTALIATGLVATYVSNQAFGNVPTESVDPSEDSRRLEESPITALLGPIIWCGCAILCGLIQYAAYMRSRGSPHDLKEGLTWETSDPDYGDRLELKQMFKAKECCGCEAKNRYIATQPADAFYIDEQSDCLQRLIASTNRELTLFGHKGKDGDAPVALRMYKPYHLQGCCFCRPSLEIDKNGTKVGRVEDPFKCCTMDQQIFDASGAHKYKVAGSICQCGMCCPCCADVTFDVTDTKDSKVGTIQKKALTCSEACTKTNRFEVEFPKQCTMDEKHLLVGAAMLLDLQYFEQNKNDN